MTQNCVVGVLVKIKLMKGKTQLCVVRVLVEPRTVWLEYWLNLGLYGWRTGMTQNGVVGVLVKPRTV